MGLAGAVWTHEVVRRVIEHERAHTTAAQRRAVASLRFRHDPTELEVRLLLGLYRPGPAVDDLPHVSHLDREGVMEWANFLAPPYSHAQLIGRKLADQIPVGPGTELRTALEAACTRGFATWDHVFVDDSGRAVQLLNTMERRRGGFVFAASKSIRAMGSVVQPIRHRAG